MDQEIAKPHKALELTAMLAFLTFAAKVSDCALGEYGQANAPADQRCVRRNKELIQSTCPPLRKPSC